MLVYLPGDIFCSEKRTVFRERSLNKTVSFEEQVMSKDKCHKITLYLHSYYRSLKTHFCTGSCTIHPYSCTRSCQLYYMGRHAHIRWYLPREDMVWMLNVSTSGINIFSRSTSHPNGQVRVKQVFCIGKQPHFNRFQSEGEKPSKRGRE